MTKKGMTLIELMVAMTIFITVMTLAIGGFIAISRSRILIGNMKDSQQKIRIANEMIVRYAKQAEYIAIPSSNELQLYFDIDTGKVHSAKKFAVTGTAPGPYDLQYFECQDTPVGPSSCTSWGTSGTSLLGGATSGITLANPSVFSLNGVLPSVLEVNLVIQNAVPGYAALSDTMTIKNAIILESLK